MSFLGGLFTGSDSTLDNDINNAGNVMGFGTAVGEGDIRNASDFYNTLLAGNPAETAKLLAPQIGQITGQGEQAKKTLAEFGNRSGGNNSKAQTIDDTTRASIDNMISQLTGTAATNVGNLGTSTLGLGLNANQLQEKESQDRLNNQQNSLLAGLINSGIVGGLGKVPGLSEIF